ncbi:MAG: PPOX class F420-dependent oxidoreductase [Acidimicrobiia bacterium]
MDVAEATAFLREHHRAVLATTRRDGRAQLSPVSVGVDDDGFAVISTRETAMKVKNLERDPHASLCVITGDFFGRWAQVEGPVEIIRLPEAMDHLVAYYRNLSGEHPDWDDYRAAMVRDRRVLLRLRIERAGPSVAG